MVSSVEGQKDETIGITIAKGITVTKTITAQVAYSATWKVDRPIGYLHAGADAKSMHWEHGSYNGGCKWIVSRQGTAVFPYRVPTFWHTS
ncbi:hypothetical protein BIV25_01820 [Streptomyces sp. MUSC 14]|uniref:hypothetical protein n=1 Tax=Streptomyces sp. MUSC 14 TaxID=1354889 RepID=UPI0008F5B3E6|nr:hypothetical protein [Streptomyces sp. MUSC 14]OIK02371.1 hypothetical protein BIV25_01820 [Streptomyces sp. MUSC 14]